MHQNPTALIIEQVGIKDRHASLPFKVFRWHEILMQTRPGHCRGKECEFTVDWRAESKRVIKHVKGIKHKHLHDADKTSEDYLQVIEEVSAEFSHNSLKDQENLIPLLTTASIKLECDLMLQCWVYWNHRGAWKPSTEVKTWKSIEVEVSRLL